MSKTGQDFEGDYSITQDDDGQWSVWHIASITRLSSHKTERGAKAQRWNYAKADARRAEQAKGTP